MITSVIFDLDGLLVDSEPMWTRAISEIVNRCGLDWTHADKLALMGTGTATWADYISKKLDRRMSNEEVIEEVLSRMVRYYHTGEVSLMPGAQEALEHCSENFSVGLASGSPKLLINAALSGANWRHFFSETVSSDEVDHGKPAPDVYLEAMKRMSITPQESVIVEDSSGGILAGKAAGAKVIAVPNPDMMPTADALRQADAVIDSLISLGRTLEKLNTEIKEN